MSGPNLGNGSQGDNLDLMGSMGSYFGTNSNQDINGPDPNAYQWGGQVGGANTQQQYYQGQADKQSQQQGAQIQNANAGADRAATQGAMQGEQYLGQYYQGILNGTAPSLAQAQMNASTDQSIAAQEAMAHSAPGGLAGALAGRNAATAGVGMQENAAQQSMIGRLQEEQAAASGQSQLLGQQGSQALQLQGIDANTAAQQAQLQQQQQGINAQTALGYQNLGFQTQADQLQAQGAGQSAQLQAQGQALQQQEFNAGQNQQMLGATVGAIGKAMAADLDLQEPGGNRGFRLREEHGFILAQDKSTGALRKVATEPLTRHELSQVMGPHGAGPLPGPGQSGPWDTHYADADLSPGDVSLAQAMTNDAYSTGAGMGSAAGGYGSGAGAAVGGGAAPAGGAASTGMQRPAQQQSSPWDAYNFAGGRVPQLSAMGYMQ